MREQVEIYDADTMQPIADVTGYLDIAVTDNTDVITHAVEDGTERTDHAARELTQIECVVHLYGDHRQALDELYRAYIEHRILTLQTQYRFFESFIISSFPYRETAGEVGSARVTLTLQEWREVE